MRAVVTILAVASLFISVSSFGQESTPLKVVGSQGVTRIGILVPDVEKAAAAFADIFGVEKTPFKDVKAPGFPVGYTGDKHAYTRVAHLRFDNVVLEVAQPMGGQSPWREFLDTYGPGLLYLAFAVTGLEDNVRLLQSKGGTRVVGAAGGQSAVVDLMSKLGINLELHEASPAGPAPLPSSDGQSGAGLKTISRIGLLVPDTDPIGAAFAELFGMPVKAPINEEGFFPDNPKTGIRDSFVPFENMWVNAIQPLGGKSVWRDMVERHAGYLNFFVDDVDAVVDRLVKRGGTRTLGTTGMPFAYVDMERQLGVTILLLKSGIMAQ